ncbi:hypothetical protein D3C71_1880410 [compost metagenome]
MSFLRQHGSPFHVQQMRYGISRIAGKVAVYRFPRAIPRLCELVRIDNALALAFPPPEELL